MSEWGVRYFDLSIFIHSNDYSGWNSNSTVDSPKLLQSKRQCSPTILLIERDAECCGYSWFRLGSGSLPAVQYIH